MLFSPVRVSVLALALTFPLSQASRGPVQLEAADCSRTHMMWGDSPVAYAVQHVSIPLSVGTLDVQPGGNGGVRIERGAGPGYSVTACIGAGGETHEEARRAAESVKLSVEGSRVRVVNSTDARRWSVQLVVEAPRGAQITAETTNGPISIDGIQGRVTATASNGPISIDDVDGRINARAINGPISVRGSRGEFDVETQNGPISVSLEGNRWEGRLDARASNGPLSVRVPERYGSGVEISSSSRSPWQCRIAACRTDEDNWRGGGRTLRLGGTPVVVRISTDNGPVTIDSR